MSYIDTVNFSTISPHDTLKVVCLIPDLPEEGALQLASKFDFSGGQIENVSRKRTVEFVPSGAKPSLERFITFCQEEQFNKNTSFRIGFGTG